MLGLADDRPVQIFRPLGCKLCGRKGYRGRIAIMELLHMDADMDELVARRATARELRTLAVEKGFRPLIDDAADRVLEGTTSLTEVSRAVDLTGRIRWA